MTAMKLFGFPALLTALALSSALVGVSSAADSGTVDLSAKLDHTFGRYAAARTALLQRVVSQSSSYMREEWEALLTPDGRFAMSTADLQAVKAMHDKDVAEAVKKAKAESVIDLDAVRAGGEEDIAEFCAAMPRAAILHIHPSGTRNLTTIMEMLEELDPIVNGTEILAKANDGELTMLYDNEVTALKALPVQKYSEFDEAGRSTIENLFFLPDTPETHDFTRFEALFEIGDVLLEQDESKDIYVEEKTFVDFARRSVELGLSYAEFTKVEIPPTRAALDRFGELKDLIFNETGLIVNFNFAFVRTISPPSLNRGWAESLIELIEQMPEDAMVGIDLLANEVNTSALATGQEIYTPILAARLAGRIDFESTQHAGELGDFRNVRDAMLMGSTRIGHGVQLQKDVVALEYARREKIGTVCSLKSNRLLQVWYDYSTHPFLRYLRLGLPVSLSTDDEGMFVTDIANECRNVVESTDIQYSEMVALSRNAITESFADDATKKLLMKSLEGELKSFEMGRNATSNNRTSGRQAKK